MKVGTPGEVLHSPEFQAVFHLNLGEEGGVPSEFLVLAPLLAPPFEWAAPDTMLFMKNALLAVLVVTPLFGLLSTMVVESRMAFFSDALGHSAFTGMAIGALCGLAQPVGAAVLFSVVIALLFTLVRQKTHMASDTAISVFSSAAVALGIF